MVSLLCTVAVALTGMVVSLDPQTILALLGPFAAMTTAGVTFFMGHQNGISEINGKLNDARNSASDIRHQKEDKFMDDSTRELKAVKKEVTTSNARSIAQLADAAETIRIHAKIVAGNEITEVEQDHINTVDMTGKVKS